MRLEKKAQYISVVKKKNTLFVFENNYKKVQTNVYVNGKSENLFANSGVCHNFSVLQEGDIIWAVGGVQSWKAKRDGLRHTDGLYLFRSHNCINWEQVQTDPIITASNAGFNSCLSWKSGEFDSLIFFQKVKDYYVLYVRDNVGVQRRWLQYSRSKDLLTWEPFRPINLEYDKNINTYFMSGGKYNDKFIVMLPQFDSVYGWISIYESEDLENFTKLKDILYKRGQILIGKNKNVDHPVNNIIDNGYFYIHHDYMTDRSRIERYHLNDFL